MTADHDHMIASIKLAMFREDVSRREMARTLGIDPSRVTRALQGDTAQASVLAGIAKVLWGQNWRVAKRVYFIRKEDPVNPKLPG